MSALFADYAGTVYQPGNTSTTLCGESQFEVATRRAEFNTESHDCRSLARGGKLDLNAMSGLVRIKRQLGDLGLPTSSFSKTRSAKLSDLSAHSSG
jgi:hypothetical protein